MFTTPWNQRKSSYDFVVIGSGYGGAVTAARIASANLNPKPSICILERGKERWPGNGRFPDTIEELADEVRSDVNPIGEFSNYRDISVVKGCGLGGTSLIHANVAATPDEQVFDQPSWPALLRWSYLKDAGAVDCSFKLRMTVKDLNEFVEGAAREAKTSGTIRFGRWEGERPIVCAIDADRSWFRYLKVNPETAEAEMQYRLEFTTDKGQRFLLVGRKYMQKDGCAGLDAPREIMKDYTTLFGRVYALDGGQQRQVGTAYLKFRTFEDLAAAGSFLEFLKSFQVTGTDDPLLRSRGMLRFLAFTAGFVQDEYDPMALPR